MSGIRPVVGRKYITASRQVVEILENPRTRHPHGPFFGSNGITYLDDGCATSWADSSNDLIAETNPEAIVTGNLLKETAFDRGDIVASMHCGEAVSGICKDWKVGAGFPVEISPETYEDQVQAARFEDRRGDLIQNRYAYATAKEIDEDGNITSVTVVYNYDGIYYVSVLRAR